MESVEQWRLSAQLTADWLLRAVAEDHPDLLDPRGVMASTDGELSDRPYLRSETELESGVHAADVEAGLRAVQMLARYAADPVLLLLTAFSRAEPLLRSPLATDASRVATITALAAAADRVTKQ